MSEKTNENLTDKKVGESGLKGDNVYKFSKNIDVLSAMANQKFDEGDNFGAISLCVESEKSGKLSPSLYARAAAAYLDFGLYNESADYWLKYLNLVTERHFVTAYNGLGGVFYLAGRKELSGYYYNLQIQNAHDRELPYDDYMYDLFYEGEENDFNKPNIKLVDEKRDKERSIIDVAKATFEKEPVIAEKMLELIPEDSVFYAETCVYRAIAALFGFDYALAAEMFEKASEDKKQRKYALNSLLGVYCLIGDEQKEKEVFNKIKKENIPDCENLFKFAALLCELRKYEKAYEFSCMMSELLPNDGNVYYMRAFTSYNVGKIEESSDLFYKFYALTGKYAAKYYRGIAEKCLRGAKTPKRLMFSYSLPDTQTEKVILSLTNLLNSSPDSLRRRIEKVLDTVENAFATDNYDAQEVACLVLREIGGEKVEKYLKKKLVTFEVRDDIKLMMISVLIQLGNDKLTGVVFSGVYSRVQFERAEFRGEKSSLFLNAYSVAFARLVPVCDDELYKIKTAAYDFYYKLCRNGGIKKVNDTVNLAAAIALESGCDTGLKKSELIEYFTASPRSVDRIAALLKKE